MVFGLPGNPCSCLTTLRRFLIPLFLQEEYREERVGLAEDFSFSKPITYFLPVKLAPEKTIAFPVSGNGSGDFGSLGKSDGFIELEERKDIFLKGESFKFFRWGKGSHGY